MDDYLKINNYNCKHF